MPNLIKKFWMVSTLRILSSTIVDKFLESILEPRDKTPLISKSFRHGTQDAKLVNFVFVCPPQLIDLDASNFENLF